MLARQGLNLRTEAYKCMHELFSLFEVQMIYVKFLLTCHVNIFRFKSVLSRNSNIVILLTSILYISSRADVFNYFYLFYFVCSTRNSCTMRVGRARTCCQSLIMKSGRIRTVRTSVLINKHKILICVWIWM